MREDRVRKDIEQFVHELNEKGEAHEWIASVNSRYGKIDSRMRSLSVKPTIRRLCDVCDLLTEGIKIATETADDRLTYYWWFGEGLLLASEVPNGIPRRIDEFVAGDVMEPSRPERQLICRSVGRFAKALLEWNKTVRRESDPIDRRGVCFSDAIVGCLDLKRLDQKYWSDFSPIYERNICNYFDLLFSCDSWCQFHGEPLMRLYYFIQPISWPHEVASVIDLDQVWCQTTPAEMSTCDYIINDLERAADQIRRTSESIEENHFVLDDRLESDIRAGLSTSGFRDGPDDKQTVEEEFKREVERMTREFVRHQMISPSGLETILNVFKPDFLDFAWTLHEQLNAEIRCNHRGLIEVITEEFEWMLQAVEKALQGERAEFGVLFSESGRELCDLFQRWWWNIDAPKPTDDYRDAYCDFVKQARIASAKMAAQDMEVLESSGDGQVTKALTEISGKLDRNYRTEEASLFYVSDGEYGKRPRDGRMVGDVRAAMIKDACKLVCSSQASSPSEAARMVVAKYAGRNGAYSESETDSLRKRIADRLKEAGIRT